MKINTDLLPKDTLEW